MQDDLEPRAAAVTVAPESPEDAAAVSTLTGITGVCADLTAERQKDYCRIWVAKAPEVVGYLLCWLVADELHIVDVAVAESARRRGVGSALLKIVLTDAKAHGVVTALLELRASNSAAQALYGKFGFQLARRRSAYYANGEDALEMVLPL